MSKKREACDLARRAKALVNMYGSGSTKTELMNVLGDLEQTIRELPPTSWWVIVLKVLAYAIGLILAGVGTVVTASCTFPNLF